MADPEEPGKSEGPDAEKLLLAAVANCLPASLLFALQTCRDAARN